MLPYENPLVRGSDPSVLRDDDGTYYIYTSLFRLYRSRDLAHYEYLGAFYEEKDSDWFDAYEAGPEAYKFGEKYYIFYSPNEKAGLREELEYGRVAILVSDSPTGPFRDYLGRPLFDPGYSLIEPHVYAEDGRYWLYWSRSCYHHPVGPDDIEESWIYGCELAPDFTHLIGTPRLLLRPSQAWEDHTVPTHARRWNEGSFVLKHGDTYYMTYSANTFEDYGVGYATAKHPLGPWTKAAENPILFPRPDLGLYAPGNNCFVRSPDGKELFMVYHVITDKCLTCLPEPPFSYPENPAVHSLSGYALQHAPYGDFMDLVPCRDKMRKIAIDRVHFTDDDKLVLDGPTVTPQPAPSGNK